MVVYNKHQDCMYNEVFRVKKEIRKFGEHSLSRQNKSCFCTSRLICGKLFFFCFVFVILGIVVIDLELFVLDIDLCFSVHCNSHRIYMKFLFCFECNNIYVSEIVFVHLGFSIKLNNTKCKLIWKISLHS